MKRNIVWTMIFFATLLLNMPGAAGKKMQKADYTCSFAEIVIQRPMIENVARII